MSLPTTYLFVPGNRPDRFDKALNSGADAIILDLEDAVDPASKDAAREAVGAWLDRGHVPDGRVLIRINDDATLWYGGDCALLERFRSVGIVLPKAERADQIAALPKGRIVVPLIETARPIAGVTPAIDDPDALKRDLCFARAVGFTAKLCIHPRQVAAVREALAPTPAERDWARRVIAAAAAGSGAIQVDGRMVDRPVVLKAQAILARATS
jgi:citrate lyase subunit beta/citryl-CoA lyase